MTTPPLIFDLNDTTLTKYRGKEDLKGTLDCKKTINQLIL